MEKDKTFILRLDRSTHGAVSTGCEESVLKDLQKDKNAVGKEREPRKSALFFVVIFLLPTLIANFITNVV